MRQAFTIDAIKNSKVADLNKHLFAEVKEKKQKYSNRIIEFDGRPFRSKKECGRYITLRAKQSAGEITDLELQMPFELNAGGTHSLRYIADFIYRDVKTGEIVVEDTKGFLTQTYIKKEKLMLSVHGITIKRV